MVEAAGIEPASAIMATSSHSQVYLILGFRFKISKNLRLACAIPNRPGPQWDPPATNRVTI